ncbi:MAG: PDC sensor domain-containing protein, partial [Candidatus Macondimonas sp.]
YQQAKAQADLVITEPYISMATCDYCISAARPWLRRDGAIGGYAVVDVRFQAVLDFLRARAQQRRRGLIWGLGLGGLAASIGLLSLLLF